MRPWSPARRSAGPGPGRTEMPRPRREASGSAESPAAGAKPSSPLPGPPPSRRGGPACLANVWFSGVGPSARPLEDVEDEAAGDRARLGEQHLDILCEAERDAASPARKGLRRLLVEPEIVGKGRHRDESARS